MEIQRKKLEIKTVKNKEIWEGFLKKAKGEKTFLQSWNWGVFQEMMGKKIWRLGVFNENLNLISVALVVKIRAKRGWFLYIPHGPVFSSWQRSPSNNSPNFEKKVLSLFVKKLKEIAKKEKCSFIRIAPILERTDQNQKIFQELGFRTAPLHINPELTWILDLNPSEQELLRGMRKTTRYLIKKGLQTQDLIVKKSRNIKDIEVFFQLYQQTAQRQHFTPFSLEYLKNEFRAFIKDDQIIIFQALYKGEVVASSIVVFWGDIAFYHHGASIRKYQKLNTSYLLQWETIREAKIRHCHTYNFWGIADVEKERDIEHHPWRGLTIFKKGFGGKKRAYVKTQDLPLKRTYWICWLVEVLRRKRRGF